MDLKQVYEIGFHILPTVAAENIENEVSILRQAIEKGNGVIISESFPKMMDLEYVIKKYLDTKKISYNKAYFGWIKFESEVALAQDLKKVADEHQNILRYLIIKTVKESTLLTKPVENDEKEEKNISTDKTHKTPVVNKEEKEEMSEKEVDESIDELVIE